MRTPGPSHVDHVQAVMAIVQDEIAQQQIISFIFQLSESSGVGRSAGHFVPNVLQYQNIGEKNGFLIIYNEYVQFLIHGGGRISLRWRSGWWKSCWYPLDSQIFLWNARGTTAQNFS